MYGMNVGRSSLSETIIRDKSENAKLLERPHSYSNSNGQGSIRSQSSTKSGHSLRGSVKMIPYREDYQEIIYERRNNNSSADDGVSDVDSIEDPPEFRVTTTQVQIHATSGSDLNAVDNDRIEFDEEEIVMQSEIPKDPVVTAYLEKANQICQNNCVKSMVQFNTRQVQDEGISVEECGSGEAAIVPSGNSVNNNNSFLVPTPTTGSSKNRRTSLSSGSVGRMETIVEEPIEAKVSVKEILARFETLRESAEVNALLVFCYF